MVGPYLWIYWDAWVWDVFGIGFKICWDPIVDSSCGPIMDSFFDSTMDIWCWGFAPIFMLRLRSHNYVKVLCFYHIKALCLCQRWGFQPLLMSRLFTHIYVKVFMPIPILRLHLLLFLFRFCACYHSLEAMCLFIFYGLA